mmetsp:Transcript_22007/g.37981  ORF Transcript_22007/g.37981 Transcript_22007/m.37981 type:complete len:412 (+) Transcript_22007:275-1510(+)|eukprot:CAMPEP_0184694258 /NCGR_PEP_ID=MMETSP0313-20130426/2277_1 /TAXON_ID=2792 /ORGANISM="Porphyridium aerugineum, Strain SAG 1380-2" /LENGTH=411 /DNA_ID=CAMNT_0027152521 /DNA_START=206 /DNA_END=1441 /DNA_ORIENTATION=-
MGSKLESTSELAGKLPSASIESGSGPGSGSGSGSGPTPENKMFRMKKLSGLKVWKKEKNSSQGTQPHERKSSFPLHGGDGNHGSIPLDAQTQAPANDVAIQPISSHDNIVTQSQQIKDQSGDSLASPSKSSKSSKSAGSSLNNSGDKATAQGVQSTRTMPRTAPGYQRNGSKAGDVYKGNARADEDGRLENVGSISPSRFGFKARSQPLLSNEGEAPDVCSPSNIKLVGSIKGSPNDAQGGGSGKRKAKKEEVYIFLTDTKLERYRRLFYMYATSANKETGERLMNEKGFQKFIKHVGATKAASEALMKKFSKSTDGNISFTELASYMEDVSAGENTAEDVEIIFDYVLGKDRDQTITFDRFRNLLIGFNNGHNAFTEDEIKKVFQKIDSDKNGSVTREEVQAFMNSMLAR